MDKKVTSIVAYASIFGGFLCFLPIIGGLGAFLPLLVWCVAYFMGDKNGAKLHLNQSLVVIIAGLILSIIFWVLGFIPIINVITGLIGDIITIITFVFAILGIVFVVKGEDKKFPIIGDIAILK